MRASRGAVGGYRVEWRGTRSCAEWIADDARFVREGRPGAWAGCLKDAAVSIGIAHRPPTEWFRRCAAEGLPVLRRETGGSALLHLPGDLAWSLVFARRPGALPPRFAESYAPLGAPVVEALARSGTTAAWTAPLCLSDQFCLFGRRGMVLSTGDRALGGAAQHLTRDALLHHGVVGASLDRPRLSRLFDVEPRLIAERLTALDELAGAPPAERVGRAFLEAAARGAPNVP